ncbi:MAG: helix-turn-helix domain-containing protein [Chloroflexota bacterium]|jgi:excisionase family DNA binding protein
MAALKQVPAAVEWLSLEQASERLGVHPTTLRRWADRGAINLFLTPGGHRRFRVADIERFERERSRNRAQSSPEPGLIATAIAQTRLEIPKQHWVTAYGESDRESYRYLGRQLMGLILQYIAQPEESPELLSEARLNGQLHGQKGISQGQSLVDLLQAISFFRTTMIEVALLRLPKTVDMRSESSVRLLRRIEKLLSEVQAGVVNAYENRCK